MVLMAVPLINFLPLLIINQLEVMATNCLNSLIILMSGSTVFLNELLMTGILSCDFIHILLCDVIQSPNVDTFKQ